MWHFGGGRWRFQRMLKSDIPYPIEPIRRRWHTTNCDGDREWEMSGPQDVESSSIEADPACHSEIGELRVQPVQANFGGATYKWYLGWEMQLLYLSEIPGSIGTWEDQDTR
jgi:hypothetical protein